MAKSLVEVTIDVLKELARAGNQPIRPFDVLRMASQKHEEVSISTKHPSQGGVGRDNTDWYDSADTTTQNNGINFAEVNS